ncbi:MAG: hypothetical protein IJO29_06710 [Oscillospiraceae bacterium]|nr:hypothetical protein [Oscillospiraceae bacterium]
MKTIGTDSKKFKAVCAVALAVMIIVQLGIIVYYMAEKKHGYHMDELWSYGLSNSYYQPHMYTRFGIDDWNEYNHWNDGSLFREYLTVGENERFEYGSVYYNQKYDVHPPLYYYILHTICSFFPGSFSPWYAFSINAVSFVAAQIFLYLCVVKISKSRFLGLSVCALWGFSSGAITCGVYLRMYVLLMAFTLIYTYLTLRLIYDGFSKKTMTALCVVTYLGSLVQYFFIIFAGAMAACMCVYYLIKKQPKRMLAYGGFLLLSVALAVVSFTPMLSHMLDKNEVMGLHATNTKHKTFALQLHFILRYMLDDISGIDIHLIKTPIWNYILCVFVALAAVVLPLCFLFRNEVWFKAFLSKLFVGIKKTLAFVRSKIGISLGVLLIVSVSVFSVFAINGLVSPIAYMEESSSHYSVQVYPLFIAVVMCLVYMFLRSLPKVGTKLCAPAAFVLCAGCVLGSRLDGNVQYLFNQNQADKEAIRTELNVITDGADCIVAVKGGSEIHYYPWDLYNADSLYIFEYPRLESCASEFDEAGRNGEKVYLIILEESMFDMEYAEEMSEVVSAEFASGDIAEYEQILKNAHLDNSVLDSVKENTRFENIDYIGYRVVFGRVNHIYELS